MKDLWDLKDLTIHDVQPMKNQPASGAPETSRAEGAERRTCHLDRGVGFWVGGLGCGVGGLGFGDLGVVHPSNVGIGLQIRFN